MASVSTDAVSHPIASSLVSSATGRSTVLLIDRLARSTLISDVFLLCRCNLWRTIQAYQLPRARVHRKRPGDQPRCCPLVPFPPPRKANFSPFHFSSRNARIAGKTTPTRHRDRLLDLRASPLTRRGRGQASRRGCSLPGRTAQAGGAPCRD